MAINLLKLAISLSQADTGYFYNATGQLTVNTAGLTILATKFVTGSGTAAGGFLTPAVNRNYELEVNGVKQESGLYTVHSNRIVLHVTAGANAKVILSGSPITLDILSSSVAT